MSKSRKYLQSNGLGDHLSPDIVAQTQIKRKHPKRKKTITPLSDDQLALQCKGVDIDVRISKLAKLKHDVAPGLGCLCNEHLLALRLKPNHQMTTSTAAAVDNPWDYANAVI